VAENANVVNGIPREMSQQ